MLKTAAMVAGLIFAATAQIAQADTLLTGAIRDQRGAAIPGARVTALDAEGREVGADLANADGTFAFDARVVPATIAITCDYCETVRRAVDPREPSVVIIRRFPALTTAGPSPDDIRALPYRSASDIAALVPFTVVAGDRIADRALDLNGAVSIDGLPFYSPADGGNYGELLPAHAIAQLNTVSPLAAPFYGGYAAGGGYDLRLRTTDLSTSRFDLGDASDVLLRAQGPNGSAFYGASGDVGDNRQVAGANVTAALGGGRLAFDTLGMSDSSTHGLGAGLAYATDSRRYATAVSLSATRTDGSSLVSLDAQIKNRAPLGLEFGARMTRATSDLGGTGAAQFDGALYASATRREGISDVSAAVAWDHGSDSSLASAARGGALVGSLADDLRLGSRWTAHAGAVSNLRIPTFAEVTLSAPADAAVDRSLLFEGALTYADLRRLRVTAMSYTQRATGLGTGHVNGIGIDADWQIAPQFSLRTWLLRGNQSLSSVLFTPPTPYPVETTIASSLTRQLIWLSYEKYVRFDALIRGGKLEGDVRIPLGTQYAFSIGTAQYAGRRVTTFGLTAH